VHDIGRRSIRTRTVNEAVRARRPANAESSDAKTKPASMTAGETKQCRTKVEEDRGPATTVRLENQIGDVAAATRSTPVAEYRT